MTTRCAACGFDQLLRGTRLLKLGVAPGEVLLEPIHGKDLDALHEAYERQQESALHLG